MITIVIVLAFTGSASAQMVDFEDKNLNPNTYWNGKDDPLTGGFTSGDTHFSNKYEVIIYDGVTYESWYGFAYSNLTNKTDGGLEHQFNAIPGRGVNNSSNYAIAYWSDYSGEPPTITMETEQVITGAYITNTNYAYYIMKDGDEAFNIHPFDQSDAFKIMITGYDRNGLETGQLEVFLAQNGNILNKWKWVDLSSLGPVERIEFSMDSTDKDPTYGYLNTPTYFALDDFNGTAPSDDDSSTCFINAAGSGLLSKTKGK